MLVGGLGTWVFAPENTLHIGASGVVFGYATYLISRGVFDKSLLELAIGALIVAVWGGALLTGLLPREGISWQGHLFGAIGGVVAARVLAAPAATRGLTETGGLSRPWPSTQPVSRSCRCSPSSRARASEGGGALPRRADRAGGHLLDEGHSAYEFFVIEDGTAAVVSGGKHLRDVGPGDFVGEIALLRGKERTASVIATSAVRAIAMSGQDFKEMTESTPKVARDGTGDRGTPGARPPLRPRRRPLVSRRARPPDDRARPPGMARSSHGRSREGPLARDPCGLGPRPRAADRADRVALRALRAYLQAENWLHER